MFSVQTMALRRISARFLCLSHRAFKGAMVLAQVSSHSPLRLKRLASTTTEISRENQTASHLSESSSKDFRTKHRLWWHARFLSIKKQRQLLFLLKQECLYLAMPEACFLVCCLSICFPLLCWIDLERKKRKENQRWFFCFPFAVNFSHRSSSSSIAEQRKGKTNIFVLMDYGRLAIEGFLYTPILRRRN